MTQDGAQPGGIAKFLTTDEVAQRYRTAPSTVRYWRMIGYIPGGLKRGRRVLYDTATLDRWDAEQAGNADERIFRTEVPLEELGRS